MAGPISQMASSEITLESLPSVSEIPAADWDACANPARERTGLNSLDTLAVPNAKQGSCAGSTFHYNPFVSHAFFSALEASGSACARTGWGPRHLVARLDGAIAGIVPCYLKSHSQGEYVFDRGWADAYERAGGKYYPKLQASVPFTPASGPRLLIGRGKDERGTSGLLLHAAQEIVPQLHASSLHITFMTEAEWTLAGEAGYLLRTDKQFHWENQGYTSFDTFLGELASAKRKNLRKERAAVIAEGVRFDWLSGRELTESVWDAFFDCYVTTGNQKWNPPYLTRECFSRVGAEMGEQILLIMAKL